jgi:hypothetical protein
VGITVSRAKRRSGIANVIRSFPELCALLEVSQNCVRYSEFPRIVYVIRSFPELCTSFEASRIVYAILSFPELCTLF